MKGNQLVRKAHSMFGWDWGPQLVDAGIWRPIYIEGTASAGIEDVRIRQVHEKDGSVRVKATITLSGAGTESSCANQEELAVPSSDTRSFMQAGIAVTVALAEKEGIEISKVPAKAVASELVYEAEITVQHPKLWWPNGYGEQPLYELAVSVDLNGGQVQRVTKTIGLRTLTVSQEADAWGNEFAFLINGVKFSRRAQTTYRRMLFIRGLMKSGSTICYSAVCVRILTVSVSGAVGIIRQMLFMICVTGMV